MAPLNKKQIKKTLGAALVAGVLATAFTGAAQAKDRSEPYKKYSFNITSQLEKQCEDLSTYRGRFNCYSAMVEETRKLVTKSLTAAVNSSQQFGVIAEPGVNKSPKEHVQTRTPIMVQGAEGNAHRSRSFKLVQQGAISCPSIDRSSGNYSDKELNKLSGKVLNCVRNLDIMINAAKVQKPFGADSSLKKVAAKVNWRTSGLPVQKANASINFN